jgi:CheY-like chemotaxis protein
MADPSGRVCPPFVASILCGDARRQTGDIDVVSPRSFRVKRSLGRSDREEVPRTVLVCDNEEALRALVRAALEPVGCEIVEARDGDESLELARALEPDLIVLDLMMPGRSGFQVLHQLRREQALEATPVIVLSARAQAADREEVARTGATSFMAKPFSPRELCAAVVSLLGERP